MKEEKNVETKEELEIEGNMSIFVGTYWLTRIVLIRFISFIYLVAFLVAYHQNKQLLGLNGLLPINQYLQQIKQHFGASNLNTAFINIPSFLIFIEDGNVDWWLDMISLCGITLSLINLIAGASNMILMFILWVLYHAIVNVGQRWYSFGWESQLLETGFLAIFLCPLISMKQMNKHTPPSTVVMWGYRWLIFRIMLGAGFIKIRGDQCWRDLTCMNYHYETQPVPNPISYYLHQSPEVLHKFETLSNHFIELIAPFFIFLTRRMRIIGGFIQVFFQVVLIISGNLSFLNWLTIAPSLACFDDQSLAWMFTAKTKQKLKQLLSNQEQKSRRLGQHVRRVMDTGLTVLIVTLSVPVIQNLFSSRQAMNTSFESFRIVNTYGAFGSITKTRTEVILQGTRNKTIIPDHLGGEWKEFEFKCKPGLITRPPCFISPYHYRLDWLMWFAAFMNYQQNPWLLHLSAKLLQNDKNITALMANNPFIDGDPPRYIRGEHYRYSYSKIGSEDARNNKWWKRKRIGSYFPTVDLETLRPYLKQHGWHV